MTRTVEQDEWQDIDPKDNSEVPDDNDRRSIGSERGSPRKRLQRKAPLSSPFPKSPRERKLSSRVRSRSRQPKTRRVRWSEAMSSASFFTMTYVLEVLRFALVVLRKPLSLVVVVYLLAVLVSNLHSTISATLSSTLAPLCVLPGASRIPFCRTAGPIIEGNIGPAQRADYPKLVEIESKTFEQLLDDSVGGAGLALDIKKAEMATSDLTTLVRSSRLTSRERMAETLDVFVGDARRAGRGLQKFGAKVGGAVDGIIAMNDYALKRIEEAASENSSPSLWRSILIPFSNPASSAVALTTSFTQAMSILESELRVLILAAEASLHDLDALEQQLKLLHDIVAREDVSLNESKQELLSRLWTIVGGNRAELRKYDSHLLLLGGMAEYRQKALAHVVGALQTLQGMSADLEALRERVARPALESDISIPLEVHVRSIRGGLQRLTEGRLKAKRIEDARYARLAEGLE